ncbi:transketolase [Candidatus Wolfebacteria bacterium CG03_land_8_20_14_0_80_40_12]|uniref:Transketolase n=1 Tax=Candidatus Wolfebacteria bacterium CG03_land_8_20_14_0_80_40_12 TaxID=1975069 RepID=A0A2M7B5C4_9BACT|nr:MAG: transketolase [Candidatus Wolfebacteria bacterium CG03_land_8_20_14_0_80_40_12]
MEQKATRDGFGDGLLLLGEENSDVVALSADVAKSTRCDKFAEKFPERFFQIGIAEQNLAGVAAGLGVSGKIPFISSYAIFSPGRNWEQIRTTICYNESNVKIIGHHAGLLTGYDGATHQALEDIALMRVLPNMKVVVPCDAIEAKKATVAAAKILGPVYIRVAREKTSVFTAEETAFIPGRAEILWQSKKPQAAIIGAGPILYNALLAAKELEKEKIGVIVLNCHTIKPIDENKIVELAKKCGAILTVEDHSIFGGLGSAVAEVLARKCPTAMEFVGMKDVFGETGSATDLLKKYGADVKDIKRAVLKLIKKR